MVRTVESCPASKATMRGRRPLARAHSLPSENLEAAVSSREHTTDRLAAESKDIAGELSVVFPPSPPSVSIL